MRARHLRQHEDGGGEWLALLAEQIGLCGQVPERFVFVREGPGPARACAAGDLASIPAAAELLRVWVEELAHAETETLVG